MIDSENEFYDEIETLCPNRYYSSLSESSKTFVIGNESNTKRKFNPRNEFLSHTYVGEIACLKNPWISDDQTPMIAEVKSEKDYNSESHSTKSTNGLPILDHIVVVEPEVVVTRRMKRALALKAAAKVDREAAEMKNTYHGDDDKSTDNDDKRNDSKLVESDAKADRRDRK